VNGLAGQSASSAEERRVEARDGTVLPGRCFLYAVFSDLLASPFDAEPAVAESAIDIESLGLPYTLSGLTALIGQWQSADREALKREYSSLFEVGSDGPPAPIREDLHLQQPAGVREDIVRFYEFFGYGLEEKFAWAPDHLSVELEFMHYLCYSEIEAQDAMANGRDVLSYQLGQSDFAQRHLCNWVPDLAAKVLDMNSASVYGGLLAALSEFLVADFDWQAQTIKRQNNVP